MKLALLVKCQHGAAPSFLANELHQAQPEHFEARRRLQSRSGGVSGAVSSSAWALAGFFPRGANSGMQTVYDLSLVVTLKTQVFTVTTNAQNTLQHFQGASAFKTFHFLSKMAPVFVEGGAPVPWHNGQSKSDRLRSTSSPSLIIRRTRLSIIVDWVFPVDVCRVWNGLPQHTTSTPSLSVLRRHLLSMST